MFGPHKCDLEKTKEKIAITYFFRMQKKKSLIWEKISCRTPSQSYIFE